MYTSYTYILTLLCEYSLILTAVMLFLQQKNIRNVYAMFFFSFCLGLYLMVDFTSGWVRYIAITGAFLLPFSFWIFAMALFRDRPLKWKKIFLLALATALFYYSILIISYYSPEIKTSRAMIHGVVSLLYTILAIYEMQRQKNTDLVTSRIRFRELFTYLTSIIIIVTLFAEIGFDEEYQKSMPSIVQKSVILLLSSFVLISYTKWRVGFFTYQKKDGKTKNIDPLLIDKIKAEMVDKKWYFDEKLTIGQLAEQLDEQEYKLREAINYGLGYRNFTDFLNSYRIAEAKSILSDIDYRNHTILEIAFKTGFNSIGPFNKAFKESTGLTPTAYRKQNLPIKE